ncbi:hypothetical protein Agub_g13540, partial [Astrephomene gubernaculifera]
MGGGTRHCREQSARRTSGDANCQHSRRKRYKENSPSCSSSSDSELEASPFVGRYTGSQDCLATESVRQVATICGTHTYTMIGYTLARAMGSGTRLCSDMFEVGGQLFRLEVYPAGLNADTHKYVSLFLTTSGSTRPGHLLYELSIEDKSKLKPQHITEARTASTPTAPTEAAAIMAPQPGIVAGFPKFIKANFLHRNARRFLPDDTLTVRATVKMLTGWSSFPVAAPQQPQLFSVAPGTAAIPVPMQLLPPQLPTQSPQPPQLPYSPQQPQPQAVAHPPLQAAYMVAPGMTPGGPAPATAPPALGSYSPAAGGVCSCGGSGGAASGLGLGPPPQQQQPHEQQVLLPAWQPCSCMQQPQPSPQQEQQQQQPVTYGVYPGPYQEQQPQPQQPQQQQQPVTYGVYAGPYQQQSPQAQQENQHPVTYGVYSGAYQLQPQQEQQQHVAY